MTASLTFHGAAGTVTGAKFLVDAGGAQVLLECGLFQGLRELREPNWAASPVEAAGLDAVLLSHAHLDHSGYLPRLVSNGYAGAVYCSPGTADVLAIMLPDAARLEEEEAAFRNKVRATRHTPALPLFTGEDAARALALLRPIRFDARFAPAPGLAARFRPATSWGPPRSSSSWRASGSCTRVISAATACRSCRIPSRCCRPTRFWSNPPTATGSTRPMTARR
ncbi:MAG TPA: MBL fold metallo-hydrolase [Methylomirabilota bacterium]|nr:MBL fold metallo-hydrolase [Methylomirabilota bacterium]